MNVNLKMKQQIIILRLWEDLICRIRFLQMRYPCSLFLTAVLNGFCERSAFAWPLSLFANKTYTCDSVAEYSAEKLKDKINGLSLEAGERAAACECILHLCKRRLSDHSGAGRIVAGSAVALCRYWQVK